MTEGKRGRKGEGSSEGGGMHLARYPSKQWNGHVSIISSSEVAVAMPLKHVYCSY